jgi:hypothetical protein
MQNIKSGFRSNFKIKIFILSIRMNKKVGYENIYIDLHTRRVRVNVEISFK